MAERRVSSLYLRNLLIGTMKMAKSFDCLPRLWSWSSSTAWSAALSKNFYFNYRKTPTKWIWSDTYPIINDLLRFLFIAHVLSAHALVLTRPSDSDMHPHSLAICISLRKLHLISLMPSLSRLHTHKLFYITSRNLSCCINNMINLSYYILLLHISRITNIRLSFKFR